MSPDIEAIRERSESGSADWHDPVGDARLLLGVVNKIQALADADEERRLTCASDPDCPCAYKDCYECGKWHNCTHTPWAAIRLALTAKAES